MSFKTAILGYGRNGSTMHAGAIELLPDFELTAVCDIDPEARAKAFDRFQCRLYEDYRQMLKDEELDLVVIVTKSSQHAKMACDCLDAGKNVLVTKPWALNAGEAREMIAAEKRSGMLLMPWLPARTACDLSRAKELIASGAIGKVFQIRRSEYSFGLRNDWQTLKEFGGGYLLNWGPHLVDQPLRLAGSPVQSVYAEMKQLNNPGDVEDMFYAVMKTQDGTVVISEWSMAAGNLPGWVIQGDRGTIQIYGNKIEIYKAALPEVIDEKAYRQVMKIEKTIEEINDKNEFDDSTLYGDTAEVYRRIAGALAGKENYFISPESALELTKTLDAIRKSAETGQVVIK